MRRKKKKTSVNVEDDVKKYTYIHYYVGGKIEESGVLSLLPLISPGFSSRCINHSLDDFISYWFLMHRIHKNGLSDFLNTHKEPLHLYGYILFMLSSCWCHWWQTLCQNIVGRIIIKSVCVRICCKSSQIFLSWNFMLNITYLQCCCTMYIYSQVILCMNLGI